MSFKFKVGQKVKLKSADKLIKITNYEDWISRYKSLAGKVVEICDIASFNNVKHYRVKLKNENGEEIYIYKWFEEDCFEEDYFESLVEV